MNGGSKEGNFTALPIEGLPGISLGYVGSKTVAKLDAAAILNLSNQERMEKILKIYDERYRLLSIYRVRKDDPKMAEFAAKEAKEYNHVLKILDRDGYIFYLNYNDAPANKEIFMPKEIEKIKTIVKQAQETKDNLMLFPIVVPGSENKVAIDFKGFSATDLNGNKVDDSIFAKYDITMVNIWATWCGPCINEMPALAKVYDNLPSNANMISIVSDGDQEATTAKEILADSRAKFKTFVPSKFINENVMPNITAFPTSVFVDKNGKVIGNAQLGAPSTDEEKIADIYLDIIKKKMDLVK
jgi:thiol-disulfide isomerase/thioredoxin